MGPYKIASILPLKSQCLKDSLCGSLKARHALLQRMGLKSKGRDKGGKQNGWFPELCQGPVRKDPDAKVQRQ